MQLGPDFGDLAQHWSPVRIQRRILTLSSKPCPQQRVSLITYCDGACNTRRDWASERAKARCTYHETIRAYLTAAKSARVVTSDFRSLW